MLKYLLLGCTLASLGHAQNRDTVLNNVEGYKMERAPTYLVVTPRKVRPNQVIQVFTTMLKLEYPTVNMRVSIVKDGVEYGSNVVKFDRPGSRLLQIKMRSNAQEGNYFVRVEGQVETGTSGNIFENETAIEFSIKQASLFIQLSKPIYRQGQNVFFRVIPILPNLMPKYGSMTIYVLDPTGFPVRRWLAVQTNAGGIVSQNFTLADQPNYGNWTIQVVAFGFVYNKTFLVEEFWDPRFDVNVTVKPYILDSVKTVGGVLAANITTGKPVEGNATVMLTVVPPPDPRYYNNPAYPDYNPRSRTVQMQKHYNYIKGPVAFDFSMDEISQRIRNEIGFYNTLENFEMIFNVSVRDWFLDMQETGFASTIIVSSKYKLQWVGDKVRTFKPDSVLTVQVAAMTCDGRPVTSSTTKINMQVYPSYGTGGSGTPIYIQPKTPVNGIAQFQIPIDTHLKSLKLAATLNDDTRTRIEMMTYRFYSPSNNYIILSTSTPSPKINEYMIFHVKLSNFVPRIYYQIKEPRKGKYRLNYNAEDITKALVMVNEKGVSVERAARSCGVPVTTLKDRVRGRVGIDVIKFGPDPLFSLEEESQLFDHISTIMAEIGYGYTRAETLNLASDYSVHLGHRDRQHPLSLCWLYNFLQRWPDVRIQKPHSLEAVRAKCTSKEMVNRYFEELEKILNKYGLKDKPERVFNIDEKGLSTDCKPPNIIAATSYKPQVVTTGKTKTVTVIGTGNAIGNQVPPYFIFPGQRMVSKLRKRASVGVREQLVKLVGQIQIYLKCT